MEKISHNSEWNPLIVLWQLHPVIQTLAISLNASQHFWHYFLVFMENQRKNENHSNQAQQIEGIANGCRTAMWWVGLTSQYRELCRRIGKERVKWWWSMALFQENCTLSNIPDEWNSIKNPVDWLKSLSSRY